MTRIRWRAPDRSTTDGRRTAGPPLWRVVHLALLALILAACAAPAAAVQPPVAERSVTLILWHGWYGAPRQALAQIVDSYNQQHPSQRVSLQSIPLASFAADLRGAVAAGDGPHLVLMPSTWVGALAASGTILPLDADIAPLDTQTLVPTALGGGRAADSTQQMRTFALPLTFDTLALYYNSANIAIPPADTQSLLESARGLGDTQAKPPVWGMALDLSPDMTIGYLYAFGGRIFDEQGRVALGTGGRDGAQQWLGWLSALNGNERLLARVEQSAEIDRVLQDGRALMTFDWSYRLPLYRAVWGDRTGVAGLPTLSETSRPPEPYVRSDVLAVNSRVSADERRAALDFMRFALSQPSQQLLLEADLQPSLLSLPLEGDDARHAAARIFRAQALAGRPMPNTPTRGLVDQELTLMQRRVLLGLTDATDAIDTADTNLKQQFP